MPARLLRPLLIVEFLIALQTVFTCWSQIGGQYHLDLMFWPWKLGLSVAAALLTTALTASLVRTDGVVGKRTWLYGTLLLATIALAGIVTYYYHLHEPTDEDNQDDQPATITKARGAGSRLSGTRPRSVHFCRLNLGKSRNPIAFDNACPSSRLRPSTGRPSGDAERVCPSKRKGGSWYRAPVRPLRFVKTFEVAIYRTPSFR